MRDTNQDGPANSGFGDISIRDFINPLLRRRRLLISSFVAVFLVIVIAGIIAGPSFSARMVVLVNRERHDPLVSTEAPAQMIAADNPVTPEEINSEVELLSSRDVLEQVVTDNGLDKHTGFSIFDLLRPNQTDADRKARAVKNLAKKIKVANINNSDLIEITYKSADPQQAYGVLKSLGDLYVAKHEAVHRPAGSEEFFARETQKYSGELQAAEDKLRTFGMTHVTAAPDEERKDLALQVETAIGQQHIVEETIAADQERLDTDERELKASSPRSNTIQSATTNHASTRELRAALLAAETKRDQLAMKYSSSYPLVQEAEQEVNQARQAVDKADQERDTVETTDRDPTYELIREDIVKTEADLASQRGTLISTKHGIESMQAEMVNLDQLSLTQQDLQREVKADESNYLLYLGKREQERTSNALDATRIGNVAIAVPPAIPVLPVISIPLLILIALGLAVVVSLGVAYAADYLDSSFHTPAQVAEILGIPVVVSISKKTA
jgi:uncharacterized protein involved in exopolysaccharide biosynthesis